jgi:hypothetical protein
MHAEVHMNEDKVKGQWKIAGDDATRQVQELASRL